MAQVPNGPSSLWPKVLWPQFARPEEKVLREVKFWEGSQPVCDKSVSPNKQGGKIGLGKIQFPRKIKSLKGNSSPSRSKKETCLSNKSLKAIKYWVDESCVKVEDQHSRNWKVIQVWWESDDFSLPETQEPVNSSTFRPVCWASKSSRSNSKSSWDGGKQVLRWDEGNWPPRNQGGNWSP